MSRMPSVGDVVDEVFRIEEELDHGNFGAVYKVADLVEQRTLALKVLKPGPHDEEELRQRFEREARLIYSLRHPHVLQVYYYGQTDAKLPYMAMEYLHGTDLKTLLAHHGGLSEALTRRIAIESLSALHCAHSMGIIHRDLKPANIYLVNDGDKGHVKVLDFGFAKALDSDQSREITNAGTLVGTPAYMSPELVHKKDVGPAADIYAMGLILAEMITGEKLVQIEAIYDTIIFQGSEKPIKLPDAVLDTDFGPVIEKAIAKDLDQRYSTAVEMIEELRQLDLDGIGPYRADVPLNTAPPEVGSADTEAHTRPRSDGRPSMGEIDMVLKNESHPLISDVGLDDPTIDDGPHRRDFSNGDPTVERSYSFEQGASTPHNGSGSGPQSPPVDTAHQSELVETEPYRNPRHTPAPDSSGAHRAAPSQGSSGAHRHPTAQDSSGAHRHPTSPGSSGAQQLPREQFQQTGQPASRAQTSALRDIFFGLVVGGLVLAILLFVLTST